MMRASACENLISATGKVSGGVGSLPCFNGRMSEHFFASILSFVSFFDD
jgi:hypothetical protein